MSISKYLDLFFGKCANYRKVYNNIVLKKSYIDNLPSEIFFETSNLCNARCIMCARFSDYLNDSTVGGNYRTSGIMDIQYIEKVYTSGFLDCCVSAHLHGFGEPLLNRSLVKFVQLLRLKGCHIDFFTNGKLLTKDIVKKLVNYSVDKIYVSFYGGTKETYEHIMKGCDFDLIIDNLSYMDMYKKMVNSTLPEIGFTLAVMKSNFEELPLIAKIAASLRVSTLSLYQLTTYDFVPELNRESYICDSHIAFRILSEVQQICEHNMIMLWNNAGIEAPSRVSILDRLISFLKSKLFIYGIAIKNRNRYIGKKKKINSQLRYDEYPREELCRLEMVPAIHRENKCRPTNITDENVFDIFKKDNFSHIDGYIPLHEQKKDYYKDICDTHGKQFPIYCFQPFTTMYITRNGNVVPCCFWRNDYTGFELGNIGIQEMDEIWNGEKFQALRHIITRGFVHPSCYNCILHSYMPKILECPTTINIKEIDETEFDGNIRKYDIIGEISKTDMKNVKLVNSKIDKTGNNGVTITCINEDPQIVFDVLNEDISVYIKIFIAKLKKSRYLYVYYSHNYQNFTEENKISLPINEGENFLWCAIPNRENAKITGIRIDPVSEMVTFIVRFMFIVQL